LSKTLGSLGGFVASTRAVADLLVNAARPYIFTTASTPADAAAALAALGVLRSPEGSTLVHRLRTHVERVAPGRSSPIVPIVLGDEGRTLAAAAALAERGLLVPAIRPPTVAPGSCRLRITLSADHRDEDVDELLAALASLRG
jgi:7-keto-8-aminopelargonate synthetase-like enzyme